MDRQPYHDPERDGDEIRTSAPGPETGAPEGPGKTHKYIPRQFLAIIGCSMAWLVALGWIAYDSGIDATFVLLIASVFAVVAIGLPALLVAVGGGRAVRPSRARPREWLRGRIETWTGRIAARDALVQVLLPILVPAIGFTLIAIVLAAVHSGLVSPS